MTWRTTIIGWALVIFGVCVSLEMSCPPAEFLEEPFLAAAKAALVPGGMLVVNVVSRAAAAHSSAASKLQKANILIQCIFFVC